MFLKVNITQYVVVVNIIYKNSHKKLPNKIFRFFIIFFAHMYLTKKSDCREKLENRSGSRKKIENKVKNLKILFIFIFLCAKIYYV